MYQNNKKLNTREIVKPKISKRRLLIFNLVLLFGGIVFSLVIVEVALRLFAPQNTEPHPRGLYTADPELGFILSPRISGVSQSPEWKVRVTTNSLSLREREINPKMSGEKRILILGDSFTYGAGVEAEETYPRRIEERLRAEGHSEITVINAGVPGYGTSQEAIWFERIVERIQPDAVLLGFFLGNDFVDNLNLNQFKVINGYLVSTSMYGSRLSLTERLGIPPEIKITLRTQLHLYPLLMNAWSSVLATARWEDTNEMFEIYRVQPTQETEAAIAMTRDALIRLTSACRKRNLPFGIVLIAEERIATALTGKAGYRFDRPAEIVRVLIAPEGVPVLDLSQVFMEGKDLRFPVDGHWNARGHLAGSRAIAKSLMEDELRSLLGQ